MNIPKGKGLDKKKLEDFDIVSHFGTEKQALLSVRNTDKKLCLFSGIFSILKILYFTF